MKEAEFERAVNTALFNVAQKIFEINNTPTPVNNPVKQLSTNYFVVMVNNELNVNTLEFLLKAEFDKRNITTDFEYGIYDCTNEKMVYGNYVSLSDTKNHVSTESLPKWVNQGYYFGVQFPNREAHILNQMGIWSFSTFVLLLVIIFFAYALFVILKQKRLSEIQKDFINNMTHEFKTPISTIAVSADVLKNPDILHQPERLINYATIIEKENNRLKLQVERVLQMAQLETKEVHLKKEMIDIHELIEEMVKSNSFGSLQQGKKITCDLAATQHCISADRLHLTNMIYNLLDNAIKYNDSIPTIIIRTRDQDKMLRIEVEDNGIGISEDNLQRIFQKFFRVPTGNVHDVKGFGLGLNYVKSIVHAHGGKIDARSELGKGSVFSISLSAQ